MVDSALVVAGAGKLFNNINNNNNNNNKNINNYNINIKNKARVYI